MPIKTSLRFLLYHAEKLVQRLRFVSLPAPEGGWPVLLGISFPKSGTHLLDQILLGFGRIAPFALRLHSFYAEYEGSTGRKRTPEQALAWLNTLRPCDVASAHLFARPQAVTRVTSSAFVPYFIFRDPRDVAVSHVFYVTEMEPAHVHHAYYRSLNSFDERLTVSILGRPAAEVEFPNIAARFAPYLGWLDEPSVIKIRFEELVNDRRSTLIRIAEHFLRRVETVQTPPELLAETLELGINPKKSPTFRSGRTGEWKKYFTPEHKRIFKDVAGDLLMRLGYEQNNDW